MKICINKTNKSYSQPLNFCDYTKLYDSTSAEYDIFTVVTIHATFLRRSFKLKNMLR